MTDYICPRCRGGFPDRTRGGFEHERACPYCGLALDGSYDPEPEPNVDPADLPTGGGAPRD